LCIHAEGYFIFVLISFGWNLVALKNSILKSFRKQKRKIEKKIKEKPQPAPSPTTAQPSTPLPSFSPPRSAHSSSPAKQFPRPRRVHTPFPPLSLARWRLGPTRQPRPFPLPPAVTEMDSSLAESIPQSAEFPCQRSQIESYKALPHPQFPFPRPSCPNRVLAPYTASFGSCRRYPPPRRAPSHPRTLPAQEKRLGEFAAHSSTSPWLWRGFWCTKSWKRTTPASSARTAMAPPRRIGVSAAGRPGSALDEVSAVRSEIKGWERKLPFRPRFCLRVSGSFLYLTRSP